MSPINKLNYKNFKIAAVISFVLAYIILGCSYFLGKNEFFLLLNADLGKVADFFFNYLTYVGDGILWIIWLIAMLAKKRRHLLPLIISTFVFVTILVQVCKQVILPNEARPSEAIRNAAIHYIDGIEIYSINSFPSGHTATAFAFALLISLLTRSLGVTLLSLLIAAMVGYTRIYQGQHFPLDVGAGILVAVASVMLASLVQQQFDKRKSSAPSTTLVD